MFLEIFSLYIKGLLLAIVFVFLAGIIWNFWRAARKLDKTVKERQAFFIRCVDDVNYDYSCFILCIYGDFINVQSIIIAILLSDCYNEKIIEILR